MTNVTSSLSASPPTTTNPANTSTVPSPPVAQFADRLETDRLILTLFRDDNAEDMQHLLDCWNDPVAKVGNGDWGINTPEDVRRFLRPQIMRTALPGYVVEMPCLYIFRLRNSDGTPSTRLGMIHVSQKAQCMPANLGYGLMHQHASRGYVTEATNRVVAYLRHSFALRDMMVANFAANTPSILIARRMGCEIVGTLVVNIQGEIHRAILWVLPGTDVDRFERLVLHRDGFGFVRGTSPLDDDEEAKQGLNVQNAS